MPCPPPPGEGYGDTVLHSVLIIPHRHVILSLEGSSQTLWVLVDFFCKKKTASLSHSLALAS